MDPNRFDILARAIHPGSRRRVLGILPGVALGALSPLLDRSDVEGKKKNNKKKNKKKPQYTTVTRTVRQSVTQTFFNAGAITIPGGGNASPYPSAINVSGLVNGAITDINLTLHNFTSQQPRDVDVLLVPAQLPGQNAIVMSDVGNGFITTDITLTLDDQAAAELPVEAAGGPFVNGTFKPTNPGGVADSFPGQTPSGNSLLSVFNGGNPNGSWQLFVVDDDPGSTSTHQFAGGWSLQITAEVDVQIQEQVLVKKNGKKKGGKKGRR